MAKAMIEIGFNQEAKDLLRAVAESGHAALKPARITGRSGPVDAYLTGIGGICWMPFDAEPEQIPQGWRKLYVKEA